MTTVGFLIVATVCWWPAPYVLKRSQWIERHPRRGILLWELLGLVGLAALSGAGMDLTLRSFHGSLWSSVTSFIVYLERNGGVSRLGLLGAMGLSLGGVLAILLCALVIATSLRLARERRQHRRIIDVIAKPWSDGVLLIEHSAPTAYFVPGHGGRVVITRGMAQAVESATLAAVIDHERSHHHRAHALVTLPFTALYSYLRWIPYVACAREAITQLVEFVADDDAARANGREPLIAALSLFSTHRIPTPSCALGSDGGILDIRIARLRGQQLSVTAAPILCLIGVLVGATVILTVV